MYSRRQDTNASQKHSVPAFNVKAEGIVSPKIWYLPKSVQDVTTQKMKKEGVGSALPKECAAF